MGKNVFRATGKVVDMIGAVTFQCFYHGCLSELGQALMSKYVPRTSETVMSAERQPDV